MKKALVMLATAVSMGGAFAQASAPTAATENTASAATAKTGYERNVEDRIAYLHAQLKITPAQEAQWKTFADVMRSNGETMSQLFQQRKAATSVSALDDMKQYATIAQAHADGMKKLVDAFDPLYGSLSPEQKKLADATFHQGGPEGAHHHHGHHGKGKADKPAGAASDAIVKP
jgi:hypothetical protein